MTMTFNPYWPEIKENIFDGQSIYDRPDLTALLFKEKTDKLIADIVARNICGKRVDIPNIVIYHKCHVPHSIKIGV